MKNSINIPMFESVVRAMDNGRLLDELVGLRTQRPRGKKNIILNNTKCVIVEKVAMERMANV